MVWRGRLAGHPSSKRRRRRTLACGEEQERHNLASSDDDDDDKDTDRSISNSCVFLDAPSKAPVLSHQPVFPSQGSSHLDVDEKMVQAVTVIIQMGNRQKWDDDAKGAFNALRNSVLHVSVEGLNSQIHHAEQVLQFLLESCVAKSMYRSLVIETLQHVTFKSSRWASVAKQPRMQQYARDVAKTLKVAGPESLGHLEHLSKEKVELLFGPFGLRLESFIEEASVETASSKCLDSAYDDSFYGNQSSRAPLISATLGAICIAVSICLVIMTQVAAKINPAMCSSFECPPHHILKVNAMQSFCSGWVCDVALDLKKCCDPLALCSSLKCPPFHIPVENAAQRTCTGAICNGSTDLGGCCERVAVCSSMVCPFPHIPKHHATQIACSRGACTARTDLERCCDKADVCSSMRCPPHYIRKPNSDNVSCTGRVCTCQDDLDKCCKTALVSLSSFFHFA